MRRREWKRGLREGEGEEGGKVQEEGNKEREGRAQVRRGWGFQGYHGPRHSTT